MKARINVSGTKAASARQAGSSREISRRTAHAVLASQLTPWAVRSSRREGSRHTAHAAFDSQLAA